MSLRGPSPAPTPPSRKSKATAHTSLDSPSRSAARGALQSDERHNVPLIYRAHHAGNSSAHIHTQPSRRPRTQQEMPEQLAPACSLSIGHTRTQGHREAGPCRNPHRTVHATGDKSRVGRCNQSLKTDLSYFLSCQRAGNDGRGCQKPARPARAHTRPRYQARASAPPSSTSVATAPRRAAPWLDRWRCL